MNYFVANYNKSLNPQKKSLKIWSKMNNDYKKLKGLFYYKILSI